VKNSAHGGVQYPQKQSASGQDEPQLTSATQYPLTSLGASQRKATFHVFSQFEESPIGSQPPQGGGKRPWEAPKEVGAAIPAEHSNQLSKSQAADIQSCDHPGCWEGHCSLEIQAAPWQESVASVYDPESQETKAEASAAAWPGAEHGRQVGEIPARCNHPGCWRDLCTLEIQAATWQESVVSVYDPESQETKAEASAAAWPGAEHERQVGEIPARCNHPGCWEGHCSLEIQAAPWQESVASVYDPKSQETPVEAGAAAWLGAEHERQAREILAHYDYANYWGDPYLQVFQAEPWQEGIASVYDPESQETRAKASAAAWPGAQHGRQAGEILARCHQIPKCWQGDGLLEMQAEPWCE
jgi:hypothetical protein